jgi:hypothetical protein
MSARFTAGRVVLVLLGVLSAVIAISVYAPGDDPFEPDAQALIATFGAAFGVLVVTLATAGLGSRQRWPWLALWTLPAFLVSHIVLLGTWVPDGVLAVLAVAALLATRPDGRVYATSTTPAPATYAAPRS